MPITWGTADTNWMLPVAAGITVSDVVLLTAPAVAVIVTVPATLLATMVVVAVPFPLAVDVTGLESVPKVVAGFRLNVTDVPSGTGLPFASFTVAVIVDVPRTVIDVGLAATLTLAGGAGVIVMVACPDKAGAALDAVTIRVVAMLPEVKVTWATPSAFVTAVGLDSVAEGELKAKATVTPGAGAPRLSSTVAVMTDGLFVIIDDGKAATVILPTPEGAFNETVVEPVRDKVVAVTVTDTFVIWTVEVSVTVATPLALVTAEADDRVAFTLLRLKVTVAPGTGFEELSRTVAVIVDVEDPLAIRDAGAAETVTLPPAKPPVMVSVMLADLAPAVAVTITVVFVGERAVNVTVAIPPTEKAVGGVSLAFRGSLKEKETIVLSGTGLPEASTKVAVIAEVPLTKTEVGLAERLMAAVAEPNIVIVTEPVKPPGALAVTVKLPVLLLAVTITEVFPPTVAPVVLDKAPKAGLPREKVTVVPSGTGFPDASFTVAMIEDIPKVFMDVGLAERVTPAVPTAPAMGTPALLPLMPEGEQANIGPSRTTSPSIAINLICLITTSQACLMLLCYRGNGHI